jgi:uncharacterized protein (DUF2236 family)
MPATAVRSDPAESVDVDWALGPGAVSWEVMRNPCVYVIGILREAILLTLHPPVAAAAVDHDRVHEDPELRFRTVARYAYTGTYGTKAEAERVSGFVRRRHTEVTGVEPITGQPYRANSDYELALTHVLLSSSFLSVYEEIHGPLPDARRDQYVLEGKASGALLGIQPEYLPSTFAELEAFLAKARTTWAAGEQARAILKPFASGEYPEGSVLGDLPPLKRRASAWVVRALTDMALITVGPEDRDLLAIDRRPQLRSRAAVKRSLLALAGYLGRPKGRAVFDGFLKPDVAKIMHRAREAELRAGGFEAAAATFVAPDPASLAVATLPDHVENMR